jgi:hypothetical protein
VPHSAACFGMGCGWGFWGCDAHCGVLWQWVVVGIFLECGIGSDEDDNVFFKTFYHNVHVSGFFF